MKVLVACEYSGVVRDAFRSLGHDAMSCDILPTDVPGPHYQGDVLDILDEGWDLMVAHPPCTYLSTAGNRYFKTDPERYQKREDAFNFFLILANANIPHICVENPQGYPNTHYRKPDQVIHPYMFGDDVRKRTCLWLKNLPKLRYTVNSLFADKLTEPEPLYVRETGENVHWCDAQIKNKNKAEIWKVRSKTFPGIAQAMAEQWGGIIGEDGE